jgi:hypothetical protein
LSIRGSNIVGRWNIKRKRLLIICIDYVIKIVGGAVTIGLIAIALGRRFEGRF